MLLPSAAKSDSHLFWPVQDVWDMCWASDNPELLAIMEKGRMVVLRGSEAEEPVTSSAWLAGFSDLQVSTWQSDGWWGARRLAACLSKASCGMVRGKKC